MTHQICQLDALAIVDGLLAPKRYTSAVRMTLAHRAMQVHDGSGCFVDTVAKVCAEVGI